MLKSKCHSAVWSKWIFAPKIVSISIAGKLAVALHNMYGRLSMNSFLKAQYTSQWRKIYAQAT
jgi:hypothetical protein